MSVDSQTSRRKVLQAVGTSTFGVGSIAIGTRSVAAERDRVEIVTLMERDRVAERKTVDAKWYEQTLRARESAKKLADRFKRTPGIRGVGIETGASEIGKMRTQTPKVYIDAGGTSASIPERINGLEVQREVIEGRKETAEPQGGESLQSGVTGESGTLTCRAFKNGVKYMMSCRHMFIDSSRERRNCENTDTTGSTWSYGGTDIGTVSYQFQNHDCVLLNDSKKTDTIFENTIFNDSGIVAGRVTQDGLSYLASSNTTVNKRGIATGSTTGTVESYDNKIDCKDPLDYDYVGRTVRTTAKQEVGDSGGPIYWTKSRPDSYDKHYLVAIATFAWDDGDSEGSAAYWMNQNNGISFGDEATNVQ